MRYTVVASISSRWYQTIEAGSPGDAVVRAEALLKAEYPYGFRVEVQQVDWQDPLNGESHFYPNTR